MSDVLLYAILSVLPLIIGAVAGSRINLSRHTLAILFAFGAGSFISALSYDLFVVSFEAGGAGSAGGGLLAGVVVYILLSQLVLKRVRRSEAGGIAPMIGDFIDGVPESLVLGSALATIGGSPALLAAVMVSNFPESFASAGRLRSAGKPAWFSLTAWSLIAATLAGFVLLGAALGEVPARILAPVQSFAAGAVIGMVVNTLLPMAYKEGGPWVAFATATGFLFAFLLEKV
ncbi:MAG TPA: ZIP family metal transporter [Patescibacteria group bacterium]|jgi:ZIP family zinc transporter